MNVATPDVNVAIWLTTHKEDNPRFDDNMPGILHGDLDENGVNMYQRIMVKPIEKQVRKRPHFSGQTGLKTVPISRTNPL